MEDVDLRGVTVSEGTLREEDLIPAFLDLLSQLDADAYQRLRDEYAQVTLDLDNGCYEWSEDASFLLDELFNKLDALAPSGYYFGALDGDGACFGFYQVPEVP